MRPALTSRLLLVGFGLFAAPAVAGSEGFDADDADGVIKYQAKERYSLIRKGPLDILIPGWRDWNDRLDEAIGLRFGIAYTVAGQSASASKGEDHGIAGDFDLFARWTLVDREGANPGQLVASIESRHKFTAISPRDLGAEIGSIWGTTNLFNDRPLAVNQVFWQQSLLDGALVLRAGKLIPNVYYNRNRVSNDSVYFLNEAFSGNPTRKHPIGIGANGMLRKEGLGYVLLGVGDMNGSADGLGDPGKGQFFSVIEAGWSPELKGLGRGSYRLTGYHHDESDNSGTPEGWNVSFSVDQELSPEEWGVFFRFGALSDPIRPTKRVVAAGAMGLVPFARRRKDGWGFGASWGRPFSDTARDQWAFEGFYRLQLTQALQLTGDVQLFVDPATNPGKNQIWVFGLRLRVDF